MENAPKIESPSKEKRVNAIYKPTKGQSPKTDHHEDVETGDEKKLGEHWREQIPYRAEYDNLRDNFVEVREDFEYI